MKFRLTSPFWHQYICQKNYQAMLWNDLCRLSMAKKSPVMSRLFVLLLPTNTCLLRNDSSNQSCPLLQNYLIREVTLTVSFSLMHYEFKSPIFFDSSRKKASVSKAREKIFQDNKHEETSFLFSSDRAWKTHSLRTDAWRPKGEQIHLHLSRLLLMLSHTWPLSTCCLFHFHPSLALTTIWAPINNLQKG